MRTILRNWMRMKMTRDFWLLEDLSIKLLDFNHMEKKNNFSFFSIQAVHLNSRYLLITNMDWNTSRESLLPPVKIYQVRHQLFLDEMILSSFLYFWTTHHSIIFITTLAFGAQYLSCNTKVPIGKIQKDTETDSSDIELWGLRMKKPEPSYLYAITPDVLLCCCSPTLSPEDFYSFSSTVFLKLVF